MPAIHARAVSAISRDNDMSSPSKIKNIGPKSAAWLRQVGVRTEADIKLLGAMEVFMKVKKAGFKPSMNLLYALEGAVQDCHWTLVSADRKGELVLEANALEEGKGPKSWGWWRPGKGTAEVRTNNSAGSDDTPPSIDPEPDYAKPDHANRGVDELNFGADENYRGD